jgi:Protein of unknown function (DUF3684)
LPFDANDWNRLTCIASGNPSPTKVGMFGVGAYSLFSSCEEPMVVSGDTALVFCWDGDALLTRMAPRPHDPSVPAFWTCFLLPARDPAPVQDLAKLGAFLASSLTFTDSLCSVSVFVDGIVALSIGKETPHAPVKMVPPAANTFWNRNAIVLTSPSSIFSLAAGDGSLTDTEVRVSSTVGGYAASISARVISAVVLASVPARVAAGMERVTKKRPLTEFTIRIVIPDSTEDTRNGSASGRGEAASAHAMLESFAPQMASGAVYIGFRTSQTTGLACHVAVPVIPTVEREAIDLESPSLMLWNSELLWMAGAVMRLTLEHRMQRISAMWLEDAQGRENAEAARLERIAELLKKVRGDSGVSGTKNSRRNPAIDGLLSSNEPVERKLGGSGFMTGFASFMGAAAGEVRRIATIVSTSGGDDVAEHLLNPVDGETVSRAEREAIILMRSFEPARSTPDSRVGSYIAQGFAGILPKLSPPVLSRLGVIRGADALAPNLGIESFARKSGLVRAVMMRNAERYVTHVAQVPNITLPRLASDFQSRTLCEDELVAFLFWFAAYLRKVPQDVIHVPHLKNSITVTLNAAGNESGSVCLQTYTHVALPNTLPRNVPLPASTLPTSITNRLPARLVRDTSFSAWFVPLTREAWTLFVVDNDCLVAPRSPSADALRLRVISGLAGAYSKQKGLDSGWMRKKLGSKPFLPVDGRVNVLGCPEELYLNSSDLQLFSASSNVAHIDKNVLDAPNVTKAFLIALGVRQAVSLDVLLSELDTLRWNRDPTGLIRYLTSVSDKLTGEEWERLRHTKFLPRAGDSSEEQQLFAPPELCLPGHDLSDLHELVPVLRWRGQFNPRGAEAQMLTSFLGVKPAASLATLIQVAAKEDISPVARHRCLMLVFDRLAKDPAASFRAEMEGLRHVKFIPATRPDTMSASTDLSPHSPSLSSSRLCSITECFADPDRQCWILGVWVVDREYSDVAVVLGVDREPTGKQCVRCLLELSQSIKSDTTVHVRNKLKLMWGLFDYMSRRVSSLEAVDLEVLQSAVFVPVSVADGLVWRRPSQVYFAKAVGRSDTAHGVIGSLFDFVAAESVFLRVVGVRDEPSVTDICRRMMASPAAIYSTVGSASYLELLKLIASQFSTLSIALQKNFASGSVLLATRLTDAGPGSMEERRDGDDLSEACSVHQIQYSLAKASDVVIVDDSLLQRLFNPLCAPSESGLESFYSHLGCEFISSATQRRYRLQGGKSERNDETRSLSDRISQRRSLILDTASSRSLRPNAHKLLEAVTVFQVPGIQAEYKLFSATRSSAVTCCAQMDEFNLVITRFLDYFDVAAALGGMLYTRCSLQDIFLLAQLLETPLKQLRARGFPVDKVVTVEAPPALQAPVPTSHTEVAQTAEPTQPVQRRSLPQAAQKGAQNQQDKQFGSPPHSSSGSAAGLCEILTTMFPEADPAWVAAEIARDPTDQGLRHVKAAMERGGYPKKPHAQTTGSRRSRSSSLSSSGEKGAPGLRSAIKAFKGLAGVLSTNPSSGGGSQLPPTMHRVGGSTPNPIRQELLCVASDPLNDQSNKKAMRSILDKAIRSSQHVPAEGVSNPSMNVKPSEADANVAGVTCDVIPGHDLKSVDGRSTRNGIRVFGSRLDDIDSVAYCRENWLAVETFGRLLADLAGVFALDIRCMSIYMSKSGESIAFNADRCLHFNLRFFITLHLNAIDSHAYMYWYTTVAHELAHNLVSGHNQLHQSYFESFVTDFFDRLIALLKETRVI